MQAKYYTYVIRDGLINDLISYYLDSHRRRTDLFQNSHQLINLHRAEKAIRTFRRQVGKRRLVER